MSESPETRSLNSKPLFETTDPDQISLYMSDAFRPNRSKLHNRHSRADFCHRQVAFASTSINAVRYGREAFVDAPPISDTFLGMFTVEGFAEVDQGQQTFTTRPGTFCVLNPTRHLHVRLSEDFEQLTVKLSSETVRRALVEATDVDLLRPLEFAPQNFALNGSAGSFASLVRSICQDMSRDASGFSQPCVSRHLEGALAAMLVAEFPHSYSELVRESAQSPAPFYVKRAEEYIRANLCTSLCLAELALAAGTSARSLQSGFRRFRQTTPMAYLRDRRLELARQMLRKAAGSNTQVTEIALTCGFTHLGKFAQHYRSRFGESPKETKKEANSQPRGFF